MAEPIKTGLETTSPAVGPFTLPASPTAAPYAPNTGLEKTSPSVGPFTLPNPTSPAPTAPAAGIPAVAQPGAAAAATTQAGQTTLTPEQIARNTALFASQGRNPDGSMITPAPAPVASKADAASVPEGLSIDASSAGKSASGTQYYTDSSGKQYYFNGSFWTDTAGNPYKVSAGTLDSSLAEADSQKTLDELAQRGRDLVAEQQAMLQQQLAAQTAGINQAFDTRERQTKAQQGEEKLTNTATQFRLGREATDYASSATQKLNQLHTDQLNELAGQRQALIMQANTAFASGKIALAKELLQNDKDLFDKQQQIKKEQREAKAEDLDRQIKMYAFGTQKAKDTRVTIEEIAKGGQDISTFTPEQKAKYEKDAGFQPGTFDVYYKAQQASAKAETEKERMAAAKLTLDVLERIPEGETISIGGSDYTGIGSTADLSIYKETDRKTGKEVIIEYNKRTKETTVTQTGVQTAAPGGAGAGGKAEVGKYFTKPKADGTIGYYYGSEKNPAAAQELQKKSYLEGVSKAAGVLGPNVQTSEDIIQSGKDYVDTLFLRSKDVSEIQKDVLDKITEGGLNKEEAKQVLSYLYDEGESRDEDKSWKWGTFKGEDIEKPE